MFRIPGFAMRLVLACALVLGAVAIGHTAAPQEAYAAYTPPALKVAVVRSQITINYSTSKGIQGLYPHSFKELTMREYLEYRGWDVTEIGDAALSDLDTLKQYDVIVLPYVWCINGTPSLTLRRYIADGGGVVTSLASPRRAPALGTSWVVAFGNRAWEWGPLTEAYQMIFENDPNADYDVVSYTHPVTTRASEILEAGGYDGSTSGMRLDRGGLSGVELTHFLPTNPNVKKVASFSITRTDPKFTLTHTHPAATASEYMNGRVVNFWFSAADFLNTYNANHVPRTDGLYGVRTSTGVPQGEVAAAYVDAAIEWAATDDGKRGGITREARTWAKVDSYQKGIYLAQYVHNPGSVAVSGTLKWAIFDPSGRKVAGSTRTLHSVGAGATQRYYKTYAPGRRLKPGAYRVVTSYQYGYPAYDQKYTEHVYVRRAAGQGISTKMMGYRRPGLTSLTSSTSQITPNGDGVNDYAVIRWNQNDWAWTTVRLYSASGKIVSIPIYKARMVHGPRTHLYKFTGKASSGRVLPSGTYRYSVNVQNYYGSRSYGGTIVIAR